MLIFSIKIDMINIKGEYMKNIGTASKIRGVDDDFSHIRQGFTLGELTIALVVITLVVCVTLPITLGKMKKVDYTSYWMGYNTMINISKEILPNLFSNRSDCAAEIDGVCYSKAFTPEGVSNAECEASKDELGLKNCASGQAYGYDADYWAGAAKVCGGAGNIPMEYDVQHKIVPYIFKSDDFAELSRYVFDSDKIAALGLNVYNISGGGIDDHVLLYFNTELMMSNTSQTYNYFNIDGSQVTMPPPLYAMESPRFYNDLQSLNFLEEYAQVICILDKAPDLCTAVKQEFNIASANCDVSTDTVKTAATSGNFAGITPHLVFQNGLKMYIGLNYGDLTELSDAEDENDREGYLVYLDVNGDSGKGKLWEDVFPFYLLRSGKLLAGYREESPAGGNNAEHLSVNVIYDSYSGGNREVKLLMSDTNFRNAACATGYIKSNKYCDGREQYDLCKKDYHDCRMIIKEPLKIF